MTFLSSLYVGSVLHRRLRPRQHRFRYRGFWLLIDLDELPRLSSGLRLFSHNRANLFSLHDTDHGDGSATPLRAQIEHLLVQGGFETGGGRIRLLCMPRALGYNFNPLSVYFCDHADGTPAALIYQVHNTFGGRHSYVVAAQGNFAAPGYCRKRFFVSPFMDMNLHYDFRVSGPDQRVAVGIRVGADDGAVLNAVLAGARRPLTDGGLLRMSLAMPAIGLKVMAAIHWEALRLWLKGLHFRGPATASLPVVSAAPAASNHQD